MGRVTTGNADMLIAMIVGSAHGGADAQGSAPPRFSFEAGLRYSAAVQRYETGVIQDVPGFGRERNSRLDYDGFTQQALRVHAQLRHAPSGIDLRGFIALTAVGSGELRDDDFLTPSLRSDALAALNALEPLEDPELIALRSALASAPDNALFSRTLSSVENWDDGVRGDYGFTLGFARLDVLPGSASLTPRIGYARFADAFEAFGAVCQPVQVEPALSLCGAPGDVVVPAAEAVIETEFAFRGFQIGADLRAPLAHGWVLAAEVLATPGIGRYRAVEFRPGDPSFPLGGPISILDDGGATGITAEFALERRLGERMTLRVGAELIRWSHDDPEGDFFIEDGAPPERFIGDERYRRIGGFIGLTRRF